MNDTERGKSAISDTGKEDKARRGVVKGVALGLGGLTLTHWSKPMVQTVVLPAHAQTSPGGRINQAGSGGSTLEF